MSADTGSLIRHYLIDAIDANKNDDVGVELEFPIISHELPTVDLSVLSGLFESLKDIGYIHLKLSSVGLPLRCEDDLGYVVTFDTTYCILEMVMAHQKSLIPMYRRYYETVSFIQGYLTKRNHALLGMGYRPHPQNVELPMVETEISLTIQKFLKSVSLPQSHNSRSMHIDFYSNIASEQVHFNTNSKELPKLFNAFSYIDFVNVLLFANSPAVHHGKRMNCARMPFYYESRFREMGLVGSQGVSFTSVDDIVNKYKKYCMYSRHRNGIAEVFEPVTLEEYFANPAYGAIESDIDDFDIVRHIITTRYGTTEYRVPCAQPFDEAFVPSAFNLGLRMNLDSVIELSERFYSDNFVASPDDLVIAASENGGIDEIHAPDLDKYLSQLLSLSREGLIARGYGEEKILAPLYTRVKLTDSPAKAYWRAIERCGVRAVLEKRAEIGSPLV